MKIHSAILRQNYEVVITDSQKIQASAEVREHLREVLCGIDPRFAAIAKGDATVIDSSPVEAAAEVDDAEGDDAEGDNVMFVDSDHVTQYATSDEESTPRSPETT